MQRILCAMAAAAVLAVSGCSQPVKPIVIDRQQLVQAGALSLTALEAAAAAYQHDHKMPAHVLSDLQVADATAKGVLAKLNNDMAVNLPLDAQLAANALQAVALALPPGVLPPAAEAALLAFSAVAQIVAQTAPQAVAIMSQVTAPTPAPATPSAATPAVVVPAQPAAQAASAAPVVDNSVQAPHPDWLTLPMAH